MHPEWREMLSNAPQACGQVRFQTQLCPQQFPTGWRQAAFCLTCCFFPELILVHITLPMPPINRMTIHLSLTRTVPRFRGQSQLPVENYNRHPRNAGVQGTVWLGGRTVQNILQAGQQAPLSAQCTTPHPLTFESTGVGWEAVSLMSQTNVLDVLDFLIVSLVSYCHQSQVPKSYELQ